MIKETIEMLLRGDFICAVTAPQAVQDLEDPASRAQIDAVLSVLNRYVACTGSGTVYFCSWQKIDKDERTIVRREFEQLRDQLRPVVEFVLLVMDADMRDSQLQAGERISEAELVARVESNVFLAERAVNIMQIINLRRSSEPVPQQVHAMLDLMQKHGVIAEQNPGSRVFLTTGRLEYVYEVLEFINQHEQIYEAQTPDTGVQEELF